MIHVQAHNIHPDLGVAVWKTQCFFMDTAIEGGAARAIYTKMLDAKRRNHPIAHWHAVEVALATYGVLLRSAADHTRRTA